MAANATEEKTSTPTNDEAAGPSKDEVPAKDEAHSRRSFEFPNLIKGIELPDAMRHIDIQKAVGQVDHAFRQVPQSLRNFEVPGAIKNLDVQGAIKKVDLPNAIKNVPEAVKNVSEQIPNSEPARRLSSFATSAFSSVASFSSLLQHKVEETTKAIQQEHEKFVGRIREEGSDGPKAGTELVAPWEGLPNEAEIKEKILALSKDVRNLTIAPPENTNFQFDMHVSGPLAMGALNADPELKKLRFDLVPSRIKEETFWRNYFYRVSLIKQTALGSIDTVVLEKELFSTREEVGGETEQLTKSGKVSKNTVTVKDNPLGSSEEKGEVLFDAQKTDFADSWLEGDLSKAAEEIAGPSDDGEQHVENWEEQLNEFVEGSET